MLTCMRRWLGAVPILCFLTCQANAAGAEENTRVPREELKVANRGLAASITAAMNLNIGSFPLQDERGRMAEKPASQTPGRPILAGWIINRRFSASAEIYDPTTGDWISSGYVTYYLDSRNKIFPKGKRMIAWVGVVVPF
jgi:hypothetical protein